MSGPLKRKSTDIDAARSSKKVKANSNGTKKAVAGSSERVVNSSSKPIEDGEILKATFRSSLFRLQVRAKYYHALLAFDCMDRWRYGGSEHKATYSSKGVPFPVFHHVRFPAPLVVLAVYVDFASHPRIVC